MDGHLIEHDVTLWLADDMPARMVYAGQRWSVTDMPTLLRHSNWTAAQGSNAGLYGWRFQGTNDDGRLLVFDVYKAENEWHVHRAYDL